MVSKGNWKEWVIMGSAVALFVTADGLLIASNMGFKINTPLQNGFLLGGAPKGDCWRALPWMGPIKTYTDLCATFANQGATKANIALTTLNCMNGAATSVNCGLGNVSTIPVGAGIRIRVSGTNLTASPNHVVLDGSHDEIAAYPTVYGGFTLGSAPKGDCWIAPPYHTYWLKAADVCAGLGLGTLATVAQLDCTTGFITTWSCNGVGTNFTLVLGEAVRVRKSSLSNAAGILPPHF